MAYQTRGRDPLLDSTTQAAIERRGKELVGLALLAGALTFVLLLWSYSPDDPNWMLASDGSVQNWLGRFGASLAHPLIMILGRGSWLVPVILAAWGCRFLLHFGEERALSRLIFAPIAIATAAVYAATLVPSAPHDLGYGLGGLFGYTALSVILTVVPMGLGVAAKLMSLAAGIATLALLAWAMGFTNREIRLGLRWFVYGLILSYDFAVRTLWGGGRAVAGAATLAGTRIAEKRGGRRDPANAGLGRERDAIPADHKPVAAEPPVAAARTSRSEPPVTAQSLPRPGRAPSDAVLEQTVETTQPAAPLIAPPRIAAEPPPRKGLLSGLFTRHADVVEQVDDALETPDGISERIAAAVRRRTEPPPPPPPQRPTRPVPLILDTLPRPPEMADEDSEDSEEMPAPELVDEPMPEPSATFGTRRSEAAPRASRVRHEPRRAMPSKRARSEAQPALPLDTKAASYDHPPLHLLTDPATIERHHLSDEALEENARMLETVLDDYGVKGEIVSVRPGPVVTLYELEPAPGLKASRVIGLADDIARSMSALSARVSTVPGRSVIGIELPNANREKVVLREILEGREFDGGTQALPLALGKDIAGTPVVANLAKMPHLLIAGTTGSGKSVAINTMILSLLYKLSPEECRLIMIDPKMLELSVYDGIPHLLSPVVTDPKKAVVALKWVVGEMEDRYRKMSKMGVRNIDGYNSRVNDALAKGECFERTVQTGFDDETGDPVFETEEIHPETMPYIVVIVDEMADLMMVAGKEIEACIQRLAQMARASGIHLIMATQRPSVDVITGTIKANFPTRISFQVTSKIDSRTILGEQGAEQLLGMGDMLYMAGGSRITRVHGPFCSDEEVEEIVSYLKAYGPPEYVSGVVDGPTSDGAETSVDEVLGLGGNGDGEDALYDQAVQIAAKDRKCSTSYIQRKLAIGYNKAARLVEQMEDNGVVSSANHVGKREVLVPEPH